MLKNFKISDILEIIILAILIAGIFYIFVKFAPPREPVMKYVPPIEYNQNKDIISDEIKDALIQSYYEYIIEMNDSCQMLEFEGILNSRVNMP